MNLEAEYDNRARVPEHPALIEGWRQGAAAYRQEAQKRLSADIPYGGRERNRLDLFRAVEPRAAAPLIVFIHGGYWRTFDKSMFSHMAKGLNLSGLDVAIPSYSLCPQVTILDIIDELRQAMITLWRDQQRRLVVVGHSAGGHLAAAMAATDWEALHAPAGLVQADMGISGLYDLRPLMATTVNVTAKLSEVEAMLASPLFWPAPRDTPFEAWVGELESPEYHRQTLSLVAAWRGLGRVAKAEIVKGQNHFSIVNALEDPASSMVQAVAKLAGA